MLAPVARQLREQTAATHEHITSSLGLLDPDLSRSRLRIVLARFAGYWQSAERLVDAWAIGRPDEAAALQWPRRRRVEILHQDLLRLGMSVRAVTELPEAPAPFAGPIPTDAEVYGWLYVSEVATHGDVPSEQEPDDGPLADIGVFQAYADGLWDAYLHQLRTWAGDSTERREDVVAAARAGFDVLEDWVTPVSLYAPAGRRA